MSSWGPDPKASSRSKKVPWIVFLFTLASLTSSSITMLCSTQPFMPRRMAFCMVESISLLTVRYLFSLLARKKWKIFQIHPDGAIIRKLVGSLGSPFLCASFITDSPQDGGGVPKEKTLLKYVARMLLVRSSLWRIPKEIPSGPGAITKLSY